MAQPSSISRRELLGNGARVVGGSLLGASLLGSHTACGATADLPRRSPAKFFRLLENGLVECRICPRRCKLKPGERSHCRTRTNQDGHLATYGYGNPAVVSVDEMGKYPLAHFRPGKKALTLAIGGCNLRCKYCQNAKESQSQPETLTTFDLPPDKAVAAIKGKGLDTVGFTYSGPVASLEYVLDTFRAAKEAGLKTVLGCGMYIDPRPLRELCKVTDAIAVTLKGTSNGFYKKVIEAELKPVQRAISLLAATDTWFELVYLVVPTYNDDLKKIERMCKGLVQMVGKDVPIHFGRFSPTFQLRNLPPTPRETIEKCCDIANEAGLEYAYAENIPDHPRSSTRCDRCNALLIERMDVKVVNDEIGTSGRCPKCRNQIPGVWQ